MTWVCPKCGAGGPHFCEGKEIPRLRKALEQAEEERDELKAEVQELEAEVERLQQIIHDAGVKLFTQTRDGRAIATWMEQEAEQGKAQKEQG